MSTLNMVITVVIIFVMAGCASYPPNAGGAGVFKDVPVDDIGDVLKVAMKREGYDRVGSERPEHTYWADHFDNAKKSGGSIFFALDPFSPVNLDGNGAYLGLGGGLLFGLLGLWGEFDWLLGEFGIGNYGYGANIDILGYRFFLGMNLNTFKHFSMDVGLGVDGKPKEKTGTGYTGNGRKIYDGHEDPVLNMARAGVTWYTGNEAGLMLFSHANYNFDSDQLSCVFGIGLGVWHL